MSRGPRVAKKRGRTTRGLCRDCGKAQPVNPMGWHKAAKPRCIACGGMLDKSGHWTGYAKPSVVLGPECIVNPNEPTEFEVQAHVYTGLLARGFKVRGCVPANGGSDIFDLVIFGDRWPVRIIEVKKGSARASFGQLKRYGAYRLPVDEVCGMSAARKYLEQIGDPPTNETEPPPAE